MPTKPDRVPALLDLLGKQVGAYSAVREHYEAFAGILEAVLKEAVEDLGILALVQARTKGIPNFAEKVIRKLDRYADAVNQFTDLCGARVITEHKDQIEPVCKFIRKHFEVDEVNSQDVIQRLGADQFGYRSVHFVVSLRPGEFQAEIEALANQPGHAKLKTIHTELCRPRSAEEIRHGGLPPGPRFKAEIQVCTLLQHAWAAISHDRLYKSEFGVPSQLKRETHRTAAVLEEADEAFVRTIRQIETFKTYAGRHLPPDLRRQELERLVAVVAYAPGDVRLALRIARLAGSLSDWAKARQVLEPFVAAGRWSSQAGQGRSRAEELREAQELVETSEEGAGGRGRARRVSASDLEESRTKLNEARDPVQAELLHCHGLACWHSGERDAGRAGLELAIALDPGNVAARIGLADTYRDEKAKAVQCYQRALRVNPSEPRALRGFVECKILKSESLDFVPMIRAALEEAIRICHERARVGVYMPQAFYDLGLFHLLLKRPYESLLAFADAVLRSDSPTQVEGWRRRMEELREAVGGVEAPEPFEWVYRFLLLAEVGAELKTVAAADTGDGRQSVLDSVRKRLERLQTAEPERPRFEGTVVMVAGGCDRRVESKIQEYRPLFVEAFKPFHGTILGGGTTAGVARLVGDLEPAEGQTIRRLTYLPESIPTWTSLHPAYQRVPSVGDGFSPLQPIQGWIDLLAAGIDPATVRFLGINGGAVAAVEYRLAAILGAKLGILAGSGRAADALLADEDWSGCPHLLRLPADTAAVSIFINGVAPPRVLLENDLETLARGAHEKWLEARKRNLHRKEPRLSEWPELPAGYRRSNFEQIQHIEEALRSVGMQLRKRDDGPVEPLDFGLPQFNERVERMSEKEHGRFVVERLLDGWRLGTRDDSKKTHPDLIAWAELPDAIKEYDREAVRAWPRMLADLGYEIVEAGVV